MDKLMRFLREHDLSRIVHNEQRSRGEFFSPSTISSFLTTTREDQLLFIPALLCDLCIELERAPSDLALTLLDELSELGIDHESPWARMKSTPRAIVDNIKSGGPLHKWVNSVVSEAEKLEGIEQIYMAASYAIAQKLSAALDECAKFRAAIDTSCLVIRQFVVRIPLGITDWVNDVIQDVEAKICVAAKIVVFLADDATVDSVEGNLVLNFPDSRPPIAIKSILGEGEIGGLDEILPYISQMAQKLGITVPEQFTAN